MEKIERVEKTKIGQGYNIGGVEGYIFREAKWDGLESDFRESYKNALEQYTRGGCDEIMVKIDNRYYFVRKKNA